jgi:hypothetical protein
MATNFPGSLDSFTNPSSSSTLDSPSHAAQHSNVNDAVEALQAKVGVDGSAVTSSLDYKVANQGLTRIFEGNMSGTTYSISNVFSSAFRNYRITIANLGITSSSIRVLSVRFRTATDDTTAAYAFGYYGHYGATAFNIGNSGQTSGELGVLSNANNGSASFDVLNPNLVAVTGLCGDLLTYQSNVLTYVLRSSRVMMATTTQYTGISFILSASSFDASACNITVYGYGQS